MDTVSGSAAETQRLYAIMSRSFQAGLAGVIAGIAIIGVGGRIVMRISGAINREAAGAITESDNVVGDVTVGGTLTFLVFQGVLVGFLLGIIWFLVRDWLPTSLPLRVTLAGLLGTLVGGSGIIDSGNIDFVLLEPAWLHVVMFLGLVAMAGATTAIVDAALDDHLPKGETESAIYGGLAALGLVVGLPFLFAFYFVPGATQHGTPPWAAGVALVGVAVATCWGMVSYYRTGDEPGIDAEPWRRALGVGGVAAFGILGGVHLAREIVGVL